MICITSLNYLYKNQDTHLHNHISNIKNSVEVQTSAPGWKMTIAKPRRENFLTLS